MGREDAIYNEIALFIVDYYRKRIYVNQPMSNYGDPEEELTLR
ncbi:hypothetical protein [Paenibacillus mendelii]|uniref:Uncharacterized protein n=1 Tax=Paenibacillus mendelii TaxID=206163 RepID=A0ABV6J669_9BACL|nr:hypothetical protein [Paenibacillus mendelii]MCQ6559929.1 hypothetical protein [Paenibacillus mendelii]